MHAANQPTSTNVSTDAPPIRLSIAVPQAFDVHFTHTIFAADNPLLPTIMAALAGDTARRVLVFCDANVLRSHPALANDVSAAFARIPGVVLATTVLSVPGGEAAKDGLTVAEGVGQAAAKYGIDRQSFIVAIGGGAMLDAVGLGASLTHRGVRLIRLPTTVLAQNDAGIGVKNGVNAWGQKNFFGTFSLPVAIINDSAFLPTLDERNWRAGIAEAIKVACIKDAAFLTFLESHAAALMQRDEAKMRELIYRCAALHLAHIQTGGDPFETGSARPLDFGHWSAHWLEMASGGAVLHGEAVAIGIALDMLYAAANGLVSAAESARVIACLKAVGFDLWHESLAALDANGTPAVFAGLEQFREHLGGELTLTLPRPLGARCEIHTVDFAHMKSCLSELARCDTT